MQNEFTPESWPETARALTPEIAIVLGSGLGGLVERLKIRETVSYGDIEGHPVSSVAGHAGKYVFGEIAGKSVALAMGRAHLYEGHTARQVCGGIRALAALGVKTLLLTNAAGSANPEFLPGDWMLLRDHINLSGQTPLLGGANFFDMSEVYSRRLRGIFRKHAAPLREGVYLSVLGPQYETPAEVSAYRLLGADAIGMSTVNEAIQARALGMETAAFSCLTNWAAGMGQETLSHQEVLETGLRAADRMFALLQAALPEL